VQPAAVNASSRILIAGELAARLAQPRDANAQWLDVRRGLNGRDKPGHDD
jgi:hypothetical protein